MKTRLKTGKSVELPKRRVGLWLGVGAALVFVVVICVVLVRFFLADPDARAIETRIEIARQAAINKDVAGCLALMDESYTDNLDNDYERVRQRVGEKFREISDIRIKLRRMEIVVEKARGLAVARFEMRTSGKYDTGDGRSIPFFGVLGDRSPFSAGWEKVSTVWTLRNGAWMVSQMRVEPMKK